MVQTNEKGTRNFESQFRILGQECLDFGLFLGSERKQRSPGPSSVVAIEVASVFDSGDAESPTMRLLAAAMRCCFSSASSKS